MPIRFHPASSTPRFFRSMVHGGRGASVNTVKFERAVDTMRALLLLARVHWLFRRKGQRGVARATAQAMRKTPSTQGEVDQLGVDAWHVARAVWRAKKLLPMHSTCLQTALATEQLFRAKGLSAAVLVGINQHMPNAHAWIEIGDFLLDDQGITSIFSAFDLDARGR